MKKALLIIIAAIFTIQSNHLVSLLSHIKCLYEVCDEEQPEEHSKEIKDDKKENDKQLQSLLYSDFCIADSNPLFIAFSSLIPPKPHLQRLSPPPDAC